jgi:hypothetical protein
VEANFSTIIYEAFQNAVKNINLLQVITIFFSSNALYVTNLVQVITECRSCSANVVLRACAWQSAPTICARTSHSRPNSIRALTSASRNSICSSVVCGSRPKLSASMPVPACARSCSGWCPAYLRGQPPQTANRHVGGQ